MHMHGIDPLHGKRFLVRKRDGRIEEFNEARILIAVESAFKAHNGLDMDASLPELAQASAKFCAEKVVERALAGALRGDELEVELIQDMVENQLMLEGHLDVARRYILYREKRRLARVQREARARLSAAIKETLDSSEPPSEPPVDSTSPQLKNIYRQALPRLREGHKFEEVYRRHLDAFINEGEYWRLLSPELLDFDTERLARGLELPRDHQFTDERLHVLRQHYLLSEHGRSLETPQHFWMRVAMGLAVNEHEPREKRALEFYDVLSTFRFIPSDLILRNAGTPKPCLVDSEEVDSADSWIEPWHRHFIGSLEGKKLWVPDLFMKRVRQQGPWSLFDPEETADLGDLVGCEFEQRYLAYERKAERGEMRFVKKVRAADLWHETVSWGALTGPSWVGFKDAIAVRSPQFHRESAPGPLGAINLAAHVSETGSGLDVAMLRSTVAAAVRMLDNAIDLNLYLNEESRLSALQNRSLGLGIAGFREALERLRIPFQSAAAADFADWSMELVSHFAITSSVELARERGAFPGFSESKWSKGILPFDTLGLLSQERGVIVDVTSDMSQDWGLLRALIRRHGIRNGAVTAISDFDHPSLLAGLMPSLDPSLAEEATDAQWVIECAARRQKWTDLGQTLTLNTSEKDIGKLADMYMQAWEKGIKVVHQSCMETLSSPEIKTAAEPVIA
jgi:ribonucleotide reductase alpha subunit